MSKFLEDGYEIPSASNGYMRLEEGDNRIRILSSAIVGTEYWNETRDGRKPVRVRNTETLNVGDIPVGESPKHFWAFVVWNYETERLQILEITQKGIMNAINKCVRNEKWGNATPFEYDFVITREGKGLETSYTVQPEPKEKIDKTVIERYEATPINLEALFDGADPFAEVALVADEDELGDAFDAIVGK